MGRPSKPSVDGKPKHAEERLVHQRKTVCIYGLIDPRTSCLRYIGKANDPHERYKDHMREMRRVTPLYQWISKLRGAGLSPMLVVLDFCDEESWADTERSAIKNARETGVQLLNVADGGDEPFCSIDVRRVNGRNNAAKRVNTPFKARVFELNRQIGMLLDHDCVREETKAKLRMAAFKKPELFGAWASL